MKKRKLILEDSDEISENNLLGIVSSLSHLQFVHFLNKTEYFDFNRNEDIEIETDKGPVFFINFIYENTEDYVLFKLIKTKGSAGIIAKELKGIDYIMTIISENDDNFYNTMDLLKELPFIEAVINIENTAISEKTKKKIFK